MLDSKNQIISILEMCGCYNYKPQYIDKWIEQWFNAKKPMIETIFERHPYYDGLGKIVFPETFTREIDVNAIYKFANYLRTAIADTVEEQKIDGMTYEEAKNKKYFYERIYEINSDIMSNGYGTHYDVDLENTISKFVEDKYEEYEKLKNIVRRFSSSSYEYFGNKRVLTSELEAKGYYKACSLVNIISERSNMKQFMSEETVSNFKYCFDSRIRFSAGQKLSRAVGKVAKHYGFDKLKDWNKEYAAFCDAVNPLQVEKWTVVSANPVDYLTFCFGNCWSTCSNIDKRNVRGVKIGASHSSITSYVNEDYVFRGEHAAACLSYMFDDSSFVYYTVSKDYNGKDYQLEPKESRIIFSVSSDFTTLLQSRLYPQCNDDNADDSAYKKTREIVQKIICDSLGVPNLWSVRKGRTACRSVVSVVSDSVHYNDWNDDRNVNCNVSWRGETASVIKIGHSAICPNCGEFHANYSSLDCEYCDPDRN